MPLRLHPAWSVLLVAGFVAAIVAPGVATLAGLDHETAVGENRELAQRPAFRSDWTTLRSLPGAASAFFNDHFAFRQRLVRWQATARLETLRSSPSPDVILGRDGWLFYAGDGSIEDYASAAPFSHEDLEVWRTTLEHTQEWLRQRGITYLFVIAPDKHVVYPEHLPATMRRVGQTSRIDELYATCMITPTCTCWTFVRYCSRRSNVNGFTT